MLYALLLYPGFILGQHFELIKDPSSIIEGFIEHSGNISSIKAAFSQEKHIDYLADTLISEGVFYSDNENNFRWEQTVPAPYILIISESTAYVFKDATWKSHNLERNRQLGYIGELITSIVNGQILRKGDYEMFFYSSQQLYRIELIPKKDRMKKYVSKVTLLLRKKDWLLDGLMIEDGDGNRTILKFHDQSVNITLAASLFAPDK